MKVKFNQNGTVSITGMPHNLYDAIHEIVCSASGAFDFDEEYNEYRSNEGFISMLTVEEKEALDKIKWII